MRMSLIGATLLCVWGGTMTNHAAELIVEGRSDYRIVLPDESTRLVFPPGATTHYAADFLNQYLEQMTGCRLPVLSESESTGDSPTIYIGATRHARDTIGDLSQLAPEALVIRTLGRDLLLCGETTAAGLDRGTLFAVYEWLERAAGVRWYFADESWYPAGFGKVVPRHDVLRSGEFEVVQAPVNRRREGGLSYYSGSIEQQAKWHPVLRFGSSIPHGNANHTQVTWTDLYGESHPDYFAVTSSGRRQINFRYKHRSYVCLTNPDVLEQMLANVEEVDRKGTTGLFPAGATPDATHVYFACNDGLTPQSACHCESCLPWHRPQAPTGGQLSEWFFQFVDRYATAIQERWPGRRLAVLAYGHYRAPPTESLLPDNVDVTFVGPPVQYLGDPAEYARWDGWLDEWYRLVGENRQRLSCWMNIVSPTRYTSWVPFMYPNLLQRWLLEHKDETEGYFINGLNLYLRRLGVQGTHGGMQTFPMVWLQSRLLWNPDQDAESLIAHYCDDLYGPASQAMQELYRHIVARWEGLYQGEMNMAEIDFIHTVRYPPEQVAHFRQLLDAALQAAPEESIYRQRIIFWRDRIYSFFLQESDDYHYWAGRLPSYLCYRVAEAPNLDGDANDPCWRNAPPIRLARRQWGKPSDRETTIRMVHDNQSLFILAHMHARATTPLADEELRFQVARVLDPVLQQHAPNIDREWEAFREVRFRANGEMLTYGGFSDVAHSVVQQDDEILTIEARLPLSALFPDEKSGGGRQLRIQLMRYWGIWNRYDLWSPTLSHISDYPTYRFGVLQLIPDVHLQDTKADE